MSLLDTVVDSRIKEAINKGDLEGLPGSGKPLQLDDDSMIPAEFRLAYRVLKNAGLVPPGIELRKEINTVKSSLDDLSNKADRDLAMKKLQCLYMRLENSSERKMNLALLDEYHDRLMDSLTTGRQTP